MKTLGIVGGLGPESTIDYYRLLISAFRQRTGNSGYPPLIIVSLDVDKGLRMLGAGELQQLADYQLGAIRQLAAAGANFALISANSGHIVFDEMRRDSPLPLISIVEATCEEVKRTGFKTVGLLGTRFTMSGRFYPEVFERHGIRLVTPTPEEQDWIHDKYVNELLRGTFLPETREGLERVIATMQQRDVIEGVVLAGTELPLILRAESVAGLPLLDTTQIHVRAAIAEMLDGGEASPTA
jgi:aspartate racemase